MPRPNPSRPMGYETNLARRIANERLSRGWTYEHLAQRVTDAGCPMHGSAVYKIEKGNPPRRILVDELVGLASAFGISVPALLETPEQVAERRAWDLVDQIEAVLADLKPETAACIREAVADRVTVAFNPDEVVRSVVGNAALEGVELPPEVVAQLRQVATGGITAVHLIDRIVVNTKES